MHESQMREIAQVVHYQQIVCVVVQISRNALPIRIAEVGKVDDQCRVRLCRIAHPDPDEVAAFYDRIAAHPELGRNHVLSGNLHALAGAVVFDAVVHAAHAVALEPASGEQRAAMWTAIIEGNDDAALAPVKEHMLSEQRPTQQFAVDQFLIQRCDVPAILEKHIYFPARERYPNLFRLEKLGFSYYTPKRRKLIPFTNHSITNRETIEARLRAIRQRFFEDANDEVRVGIK